LGVAPLWLARAVSIVAIIAMMAIRAPHGRRSRTVTVVDDRKDTWEILLLLLSIAGWWLPLVWAAASILAFADYPLRVGPLAAGVVCYALGLALFYRSHADLGTNWSVTLQLRNNHRLITRGVYRYIRHPMYSALLVYAAGQALVVPNWLAGPSYLISLAILCVRRVALEEAMMLDTFGDEYTAYTTTTSRFIPGIW